MVPEVGIEPTRGCPRRILNPVRLPISPLRHSSSLHLRNRKYTITLFELAKYFSPSTIPQSIVKAAFSIFNIGYENLERFKKLFQKGQDIGLGRFLSSA